MMGFSQVVGTQELRKYMVRGKEIAAKHVEVFGSKLNQGDLFQPPLHGTARWRIQRSHPFRIS